MATRPLYTPERCPVCRARVGDATTCQRCGADLTALRQIQAQADALMAQSIRAYARQGNAVAARQAVEQALMLRHDPLFDAWRVFLEQNKTTRFG